MKHLPNLRWVLRTSVLRSDSVKKLRNWSHFTKTKRKVGLQKGSELIFSKLRIERYLLIVSFPFHLLIR